MDSQPAKKLKAIGTSAQSIIELADKLNDFFERGESRDFTIHDVSFQYEAGTGGVAALVIIDNPKTQ